MGTTRRIYALGVAAFALLALATAQQCTSGLNGSLLLADGSIYKADGNVQNEELVASTPGQAIGIDYDYQRNVLYWSDLVTSEIYALDEKSSKPRLVVPKQSKWMPFSLALDSVTEKLYVGDSFSGTVSIFDLRNEANHAVVVGGKLSQVRSIAVDVNAGYLFVLDKYQILRTDLDGANYKLLLQYEDNETGHKFEDNVYHDFRRSLSVFRILVDQEAKRLYWVDSLARQVESSDYDGQDRKVHFHDSHGQPIGESLGSLALLDGYLYWSDVENEKVFKIDAKTGQSSVIPNKAPLFIKAITCPSQKPINNPCANNNGGCEQLCVLSKSSQKNYRCACGVGYELGKDQKSCATPSEFLLFTKGNYIRGQSMSEDGKLHADVINPSQFPVGSNPIVDYNAEAGIIYHNSNYPKNQLYQVRLDNGKETQLKPDLISTDVANLAYDWASKNLYYFTYYYADMISLNVLNVDDPTYSKILLDNLNRLVTDIAVHPHKGYVYLAQKIDAKDGRISRLATDGSDLKVIAELPKKSSVEGLAVDVEEDKLYWSQVELGENNAVSFRIRRSNLDGSDIQDLPLPHDVFDFVNLHIHGDYIYGFSGPQDQLIRLNKKNLSSGKLVLVEDSAPGSLNTVKLYSKKAQNVKPDHPCASGKHQCAKFCFAVPNGEGGVKGVCGCPYGEKLAEDGKSCVDNSKEEPPFLPCKFSFKCNKQTA